MNKKLLYGFLVVFVLAMVLNYVVNMFLMTKEYLETTQLWRTPEEMKMWVIIVVELIFALFFTFIFSKGYEGKGMMEGLRYGFYVSLMVNIPSAYMTYATMPVPYMLALKWFLYGTVEFLIFGAALGLIYGKKAVAPAVEAKKVMEPAE